MLFVMRDLFWECHNTIKMTVNSANVYMDQCTGKMHWRCHSSSQIAA